MNDRPINEYLAHLIAQANRQLSRQLTEEGVPLDQWRILKILIDTNGLSMGEAADLVAMNSWTLTKIIDRMVSEALVYRIPDPDDRRKVRLAVSEKGRSLFARQNALVSEHQTNLENSYGDKQTQQLKSLLESFIRQIS
ncbi:MarR family transcriptional regulator [Bradyrhizobium diazoefficiens]|nr:MarR family transcriptional regulator [Bradyrhizobium diazoefficiens]QQN66711.1 MarR family transcriptional regulator [Bradyrhizobium diazoefficiens]